MDDRERLHEGSIHRGIGWTDFSGNELARALRQTSQALRGQGNKEG
jgi:hypothetical protein